MTITKGSLEYHISYGLHSNIPQCCIISWLSSNSQDEVTRLINLRDKYISDCNYVPCLTCIKSRKSNKIVRCERHKKPCCFLPKGRNPRLGPPMKVTLTKVLEAKMAKFKEHYGI